VIHALSQEVPETIRISFAAPVTIPANGTNDRDNSTIGNARADRAMMIFRNLAIVACGVAASCGVPADTSHVVHEDETVKAARKTMIGMSEAEVRMCAGFPTSGVKISDAEKIWTYQRNYARGNVNVGVTSLALGPMPGVTGATGVGAEGFCNTQVRFVDGHVAQVEFAGDNNTLRRINGLCVSTIDACVAYARRPNMTPMPAPR
jgi:hypothetical protein